MKRGYYISLYILGAAYVVSLLVLLVVFPYPDWVAKSISLTGSLAAVAAALVALGIADRPQKVVDFRINMEVSKKREDITTYDFKELSSDVMKQLIDQKETYPDSYRVFFTIRNQSGFTLKKPVVTFELPVALRHPNKWGANGEEVKPTYNSNLYNVQYDIRHFEFEDRVVLSNNILPYLNDGQELKIWIRMCLDKADEEEYLAVLSLNCDNAEGKTEERSICPRDLLKGFESTD